MTDDPPVITAIRPLRTDPDRATIRVGKRTAAIVPWDEITSLHLRVGDVWDEPTAERVRVIAAAEQVRVDALRLINRRDYSSGELRFKLLRKSHEESTVEIVVRRMIDKGLIDDEAYARSTITAVRSRGGAGDRLLRHKLMLKRLPRDLIDRLVAEAGEQHDAVADARRVAEKRLASASLQRCDANKRRQRLWSLLARRGFDSETIGHVMSTLDGLDDACDD